MSRSPWMQYFEFGNPWFIASIRGMRRGRETDFIQQTMKFCYNRKCNGFSAPESLKFEWLFFFFLQRQQTLTSWQEINSFHLCSGHVPLSRFCIQDCMSSDVQSVVYQKRSVKLDVFPTRSESQSLLAQLQHTYTLPLRVAIASVQKHLLLNSSPFCCKES